jgi:hypothetical protein
VLFLLTVSNRNTTDSPPAAGSGVKRARVPAQKTGDAHPGGAGQAASAGRKVGSPAGSGLSDEANATWPTGYAEHGDRVVRIRAVCREPLDLDPLVATLLALAVAEMDEM